MKPKDPLANLINSLTPGLVQPDTDLARELARRLADFDRDILIYRTLDVTPTDTLVFLRILISNLSACFQFIVLTDGASPSDPDVAGADPAAAATTKPAQGEPS